MGSPCFISNGGMCSPLLDPTALHGIVDKQKGDTDVQMKCVGCFLKQYLKA